MIKLLEEIIQSGKDARLPLDMGIWVDNDDNFCATSCCMCGDVAISRMSKKSQEIDVDLASEKATDFSDELDEACWDVFGNSLLARSIYAGSSGAREERAYDSGLLTEEELKHPHLNYDHHSREIAYDYVRLVIKKVREKLS